MPRVHDGGGRRQRGLLAPAALDAMVRALEAGGASFALETPAALRRAGPAPPRARIVFRDGAALAPLARGDLTGLAEAYLGGAIDVEGDFREAVKITELLAPGPSRLERIAFATRVLLPGRARLRRAAIAAHYDRPAAFFLPWFERWRSYTHGLYLTPDDPPQEAQARKLQRAVDALALGPGASVLDVGSGWGSFVEYAGRSGIHVHGITLSAEQHRFTGDLIERLRLPCTVERVDFFRFRPKRRYDAVVFMGSLEHLGSPRRVVQRLSRWLAPEGRVWADFCAADGGNQPGAFLARHVFPGARYVDAAALTRALRREGFSSLELSDDTPSYALTCRDWADALERERKTLVERFGERDFRIFQVYLRASQHFFETGRTRAHHLVAARTRAHASPAAVAARQSQAKASPERV